MPRQLLIASNRSLYICVVQFEAQTMPWASSWANSGVFRGIEGNPTPQKTCIFPLNSYPPPTTVLDCRRALRCRRGNSRRLLV